MHSELLDSRILNQLDRQVKTGKWATTYLFTGRENERKKALAVAFAKALNCGKGNTSCTCSVCRRIDEGTYPDVKWYGLDEEVNTIKISDVRDFKNWLSLKSFEAKVKVFIFNQAERLTGEAQNALLKSLEEPPPGNVILLLVPKAEALFDTIASRALEIKVPSFSSQEIRKVLIQEAVEKTEAEVLARMAHGELTRAREAYAQKLFRQKNQWIDQLVKNPTYFLDQFQSASRDELASLFDFLIEWFRDLLAFHASRDPQYLIHLDRHALIETLVQKCSFDSLVEILEELNQLKKSLNDYANQKLAITQAQILLEHFFKP